MNSFLPLYLKRAMEYAAGIQNTIETRVVMIAMIKDWIIDVTRDFCPKIYPHHLNPHCCGRT